MKWGWSITTYETRDDPPKTKNCDTDEVRFVFLLGDTERLIHQVIPGTKNKHALKWMEMVISKHFLCNLFGIIQWNKPIHKWMWLRSQVQLYYRTRNQTNHPSVDDNSQLGKVWVSGCCCSAAVAKKLVYLKQFYNSCTLPKVPRCCLCSDLSQ